jgi:hypothetical protein
LIKCELQKVGSDNLIIVTGGTKPHIGAVVTATFDAGKVNIVSHGLPHHREEDLFVELAKVWCSTFQRNTVLLGGIHIDKATRQQIIDLVDCTWVEFRKLVNDNLPAL